MSTTGTHYYSDYVSEIGIQYDVDQERIEKYCNACAGSGTQWFSTPEDLAAFGKEEAEREEERERMTDLDMYDDYSHSPSRSGRKACERCSGTGDREGDGPITKLKMTAFGSVNGLQFSQP